MSEVSCSNCKGACCLRGAALRLTAPERDFLEEGGAHLLEVSPPPESDPIADLLGKFGSNVVLASGSSEPRGTYVLNSDCGYLEKDGDWPTCKVYDDERRPQVCKRFTVGSPACHEVRVLRGVDPEE